jgi:endonuclease/exonuclease/phosphatase family metal-dependent hydrolase
MSTHQARSQFSTAWKSTRRRILSLAAGVGLAFVCSSASAQTLRIVAYNIEADTDGVTTPRSGLYTVLEAIGQQSVNNIARPIDILALEETTSNTATIAPIVTALNSYYGAGTYALVNYQGTQQGSNDDGNGPNALIYNTTTVSLVLQNGAQAVGVPGTPSSSGGALRQVIRYEFQAVGGPAAANFYVYVSHMKSSSSGSDATDQADRNTEAGLITTDIAKLPAGSSVLSMGDFNMDGSSEAAYQTLTTNGPLVDPLNVPQNNSETWDSATYQAILTESDTKIEYRDDIQFATQNVYSGSSATGLHYVPGSLHAFANNGSTKFETSVNLASNTSLNTNFSGPITASAALSALTTASDHLPIVADYVIATPFTTWQAREFTAAQLANAAISGPTADPDGDGIPNLLEYALNLNPEQASVQGLPTIGQTTINGQQYLTLTYTEVIAATDITYVPQVSGDLATWNSGSSYTALVSLTNNGDGVTETAVTQDLTPISSAAPRFMRLEITKP